MRRALRLAMAVLLLCIGACASATSGEVEAAREVAANWIALSNNRDARGVVSLFRDQGISFSDPSLEEPVTDKAEVLELYESLFALPGVEVVSDIPIVADDGSRIVIPWTWSGLDTATDEFYTIDGASIFVIEDGKIVSETAIYDPGGSPFAPQQITISD